MSQTNNVRVLITGANGFIGKNLTVKLHELGHYDVIPFERGDALSALSESVVQADVIIHLAGENRPQNPEDFSLVNAGLTQTLCEAIQKTKRHIPLIYSSSTQAALDNLYGKSKREGEKIIERFSAKTANPAAIYRLPGVFGKWCRPNYNSVVATFCHNVANDLPIQIHDLQTMLCLVYIDDVTDGFIRTMTQMATGVQYKEIEPQYAISLGELAQQIYAFKESRNSLITEKVGTGLTRALYSTYLSYLPPGRFVYDLTKHGDERGVFTEMLKTPEYGQFSYFTAHPGVTRGGHYHHSKCEKFLVVRGEARFRFRHILTDETYNVSTSGEKPQVVETVPGWTHDITNIGSEEMVVLLWANEIFDREHPDTITCRV